MSSTAVKKRLDEKNSKLIRELSVLPDNRHCFECGQRGPTYVNVTEGSFCCTACSGILRGLNPPHRVKSISMATFTTEEVEKLRRLGNSENTKTWLGLYESISPIVSNKDELHSFLVKKYEKKTWYVSPDELAEQERLISKAKKVASIDSSIGQSSVLDTTVPKTNSVDLFSSDSFDVLTNKTNSPPKTQVDDSTPFSPPAFLAPVPPKVERRIDLFFAEPLPSLNTLNLSEVATAPVTGNEDFGMTLNQASATRTNIINLENLFLPHALSASTRVNFALDTPPNHSSTTNPCENREIETCNDKYSAVAELDEMFHKQPQPGDSVTAKPHWMPSGFLTGLPPLNHQPRSNVVSGPPDSTYPALNIPKSNTMGALSDYHGVNPFVDNRFSTRSGNMAFSNPFLSNALPMSNIITNPPPVPPRPQHTAWTANFEQQTNTKANGANAQWNPFL